MSAAAALAERLGLPTSGTRACSIRRSSTAATCTSIPTRPRPTTSGSSSSATPSSISPSPRRCTARHPDDDEGAPVGAPGGHRLRPPGLARLADAARPRRRSSCSARARRSAAARRRPSLLASAFEALVGALYLDLGWEAARDWLLALAAPGARADTPLDDPQEPEEPAPGAHAADDRRAARLPHRRRVGPDHEKRFRIEVCGRRRASWAWARAVAPRGRDRGRRRRPSRRSRRERRSGRATGGRPTAAARRADAATGAGVSAPPRLLGLRLQGFKSFAERTVVEFGPGISAVVGPNGSGKSNLADALRWALGEQGRVAADAQERGRHLRRLGAAGRASAWPT